MLGGETSENVTFRALPDQGYTVLRGMLIYVNALIFARVTLTIPHGRKQVRRLFWRSVTHHPIAGSDRQRVLLR